MPSQCHADKGVQLPQGSPQREEGGIDLESMAAHGRVVRSVGRGEQALTEVAAQLLVIFVWGCFYKSPSGSSPGTTVKS